jgi:hypothetical protein
MFYILSWLIVLVLLAFWSLGAWALQAITLWSTANAGTLSGHTKVIEDLQVPAWLTVWLPAEWVSAFKSIAMTTVPWVESALSHAPALGSGLSVAIWVLWGVGAALLLLLGALLHGVVAMLRRRTHPTLLASHRQAVAR